jgi:epoxyqueuosine reductase QueG
VSTSERRPCTPDPGETDPRALLLEIEGLAVADGLHSLGVADLAEPAVQAEIARQGGAYIAGFPRAVSLVHRLQDSLVDPLPMHHRDPGLARLYEFHVYKVVNARLDDVAESVATTLQRAGHRALPVPTSLSVDDAGRRGIVSHKLIARQAGLGWIGRNCLLVTPEAGPRVRLATVLTDAPLPPDAPGDRSCGACHICVRACPAAAFSGRRFSPEDPLAARMDVEACDRYRQAAKQDSGVTICGVCVSVCPHGRPGDASPAADTA